MSNIKNSCPLVSVIIPFYNVYDYIDACIDSIRKQTYSNLEIILVNDCSPDDSISIAKRHADEDSRIVLIQHEVNKGLGAARNTGIEIAKGDYFVFVDSDDMMPFDAIEMLMAKCLECNADMCIGSACWNKEGIISPVNYVEHKLMYFSRYPYESLRYTDAENWSIGGVWGRVYSRDLIIGKNIRHVPGIFWEDVTFSVAAWENSRKICNINDIVYWRTERNDESNPSITQEYKIKKYLDRDIILDELYRFYQYRCSKKLSTKKTAITVLRRFYNTTLSIVPFAHEECKEEVDKWLETFTERYNQILGSFA